MNKAILSLLILAVCALNGCAKKPVKKEITSIAVTTFCVTPQTIPANYEYVGVARSSHPVEIRARVEGYLLDIAYKEGTEVCKDQILFHIDPKPFEAALDEAQGELAEKQALLWNAKRNVERLKPLFDQNAVSRRDLDVAISQELATQAQVASAKAKVESAELNLGYTTITSPINGMAGASKFRAGTLISPGSNGLLTTVSIVNPIWVYFSISDTELLEEQQERKAHQLEMPEQYDVALFFSDGSKFPYMGQVKFTSPTLDQQTGTLMLRATFPNPQNQVKPGQFVRVRVMGAYRPNAIFVPQTAVMHGLGGAFVYVVEEGRAKRRNVTAGGWYSNYWIIKSGLKARDEVVVEGVNKIQEGWPVKIIKTDLPPPPGKEETLSLTCEA